MRLPFLILSLIIVIGLGLGYLITWPLYQSWQQEQTKLTALSTELRSIKEHRKQAREITAVAETIHTKALAAKQLIPVAEERESFISEQDGLAKQRGVTLSVLNFQKAASTSTANNETKAKATAKVTTKKKTGATSLGFTASVTGPYANVHQFLTQLRTTQRYLTISSLSLTSREAEVAATIEGQVYTMPEPKTQDSFELIGNKVWSYLDKRFTPVTPEVGTTTGRTNPFIAY